MNLSLLPVTGLTLPFISSGGSSLLTLLFGIGLVRASSCAASARREQHLRLMIERYVARAMRSVPCR